MFTHPQPVPLWWLREWKPHINETIAASEVAIVSRYVETLIEVPQIRDVSVSQARLPSSGRIQEVVGPELLVFESMSDGDESR